MQNVISSAALRFFQGIVLLPFLFQTELDSTNYGVHNLTTAETPWTQTHMSLPAHH